MDNKKLAKKLVEGNLTRYTIKATKGSMAGELLRWSEAKKGGMLFSPAGFPVIVYSQDRANEIAKDFSAQGAEVVPTVEQEESLSERILAPPEWIIKLGQKYIDLWNVVTAKLGADASYGAAVAYFKNKAKARGLALPECDELK